MKRLPTIITCLCLIASTAVRAEPTTTKGSTAMPMTEDLRAVAPALEKYGQTVVIGDLWKRPGLPPRDRSIVTVAALIARNQTVELPYYLGLALDSGHVYWANDDGPPAHIGRADLNGNNLQGSYVAILPDASFPCGVAVNSSNIFCHFFWRLCCGMINRK